MSMANALGGVVLCMVVVDLVVTGMEVPVGVWHF